MIPASLPSNYPANNPSGYSGLHSVLYQDAFECSPKVVAHFLKFPSEINSEWETGGGTPLHILLANERESSALALLKEVAKEEKKSGKPLLNLQRVDRELKTLFILAAKLRQWEVCKFLVDHFPQAKEEKILNWQDNQGRTCAHYMTLYGELRMLHWFRKLGGSLRVKDKHGHTAREWLLKVSKTDPRQTVIDVLLSVEVHPLRSRDAPCNMLPALKHQVGTKLFIPRSDLEEIRQLIQAGTHWPQPLRCFRVGEKKGGEETEQITFENAEQLLSELEANFSPERNLLCTPANVLLASRYVRFWAANFEPALECLSSLKLSKTTLLEDILQKQDALVRKYEKLSTFVKSSESIKSPV